MLYPLVVLIGAASAWSLYSPTDRIIGGYSVEIEQRPFQVSILLYGEHFCGGSIIRNNVILTAAHCLVGVSKDYLKVRIGSTDRTSGGKLIAVRKTLYNENYDDATSGSDIGLIWLDEILEFNDKVGMISLPLQDETFAAGLITTVSGWGLLAFEGDLADTLQEVQIPLVDHEVCSREYRGLVNQDMICAGDDEGGKDACQMDSGGPLTAVNKQIGIVSFGYECAVPHYPGVYTNVAHFREWIENKILEDQISSRV
ncbi:trypsin-2-like [Hermetia illucens]|uniref:trypsin-2-like n=1 Tax=Hermetia illucens TaxID=343691 RepID=UPI0018CC5B4F|nr:trypsin-2-like [Hermetia illucens]